MTDEPTEDKKPNLPPPGLPPGPPPGLPPRPQLPPGPPPMRGSALGLPPLPPASPKMAVHLPPPPSAPLVDSYKQEMEDKIALLEKKLEKEHEQVLLANLKSKEEKEISTRVELSIKDIQDKLRRDRRDAQHEEERLKLEGQLRELENRLVQERETWVSTLKNQMAAREGQDKEVETHFAMRIQEMERRWLEEKAHWQSTTNAKALELQKAMEKLERLEGIESRYEKANGEREVLEKRVLELTKDRDTLEAKSQSWAERERDYFQMKADLQIAREQLNISNEKYEREVAGLRSGAKEREQRLLSDNERLQAELGSVTRRIRAEYEAEVRRIRAESDGDLKKARAQADLTGAALQRMRAVGSALEKQVASLRAQATEAKSLKEEMQKINDRYKAEFIVLQRKWQDREADLNKKAEVHFEKRMETEKAKLKLRAQDEIQTRVLKAQEELRREMAAEIVEKERAMRGEVERVVTERTRAAQKELDEIRKNLEEELGRKTEEYAKRELHWQERLVRAETEVNTVKAALEDVRMRFQKEEELRLKASTGKSEAENHAAELLGKMRSQQADFENKMQRLSEEEALTAELKSEKEAWEQSRLLFEERLEDARREKEALNEKLKAADAAHEGVQNEKVELQETVAKIEAEHSRQLETWRRKLDLVRRDFEERLKSVESERARSLREMSEKRESGDDASGGKSFMSKITGLWKKKHTPPEPPAPPMMGSV